MPTMDEGSRVADHEQTVDLTRDEAFRSLVSVTADGLLVIDPEGVVLFMNPSAESLLGADLVGDPLGCPLVDGDTTELDVLRGGSDCVVEMRTVQTTWSGEPAYVASLRDVTERKQAYERQYEALRRLEELNRLKDDFVALVSHDLRSPMTVIGGWAKTLRANWDQFDDGQRDRAFDRIEQNVDHLTAFVESILQIARIESGEFPYDVQPFDIQALIRRTTADLGDGARGVVIEVKAPGDLPAVVGDEERVWQVLMNLLSNAIKFSPSTGRVTVIASAREDTVDVSVSDEGPGIPPDDQEKLFKKFSRLAQPLSSDVKGTGLGLYITKLLVEGQGGCVRIESEPGSGSTFTFSLPRAL